MRPERIVGIGGPAAVSDELLAALEGHLGVPIDRIAGQNRYETAVSLAAGHDRAETVWLASGEDFPDALAAAPAAARDGAPLLLVHPERLPAETADALSRLGPNRLVVVGGPAAVPDEVADRAAALTGAIVERVAGGDRYETAVAVSRLTYAEGAPVAGALLATGRDYPDALAGGILSAAAGAPILLNDGDGNPATHEELARLVRAGASRILGLGGPNALLDTALPDLADLTL